MTNILIGIIGEDKDAGEVLFKSFTKFFPQKIILLVKAGNKKISDKVIKKIEKINLEFEIEEVSNFLELDEVFNKIKFISNKYKTDAIAINVDCDYMSSCLALSSAFVNGIPAIGILKNEIISYPIMKFSYYNVINKKKLEILKAINERKKFETMQELSNKTKLSLPLIAYHLKGNRDSKGLEEMNLIETQKKGGDIKIKLTELGKLIVNGDIDLNKNN